MAVINSPKSEEPFAGNGQGQHGMSLLFDFYLETQLLVPIDRLNPHSIDGCQIRKPANLENDFAQIEKVSAEDEIQAEVSRVVEIIAGVRDGALAPSSAPARRSLPVISPTR